MIHPLRNTPWGQGTQTRYQCPSSDSEEYTHRLEQKPKLHLEVESLEMVEAHQEGVNLLRLAATRA
jgi:hypothetical protein